MILSVSELRLSAFIKYQSEIPGFDKEDIDESQLMQEVLADRLFEQGILEKAGDEIELEGDYCFSALGDAVINCAVDPDVWISIKNDDIGTIRRVFIKNELYICMDEYKGMLHIVFLPLLPMVFGAIADSFDSNTNWKEDITEEKNKKLHRTVEGISDGKKLEMNISDSIDESVFQSIIQWVIGGLKDVRREM